MSWAKSEVRARALTSRRSTSIREQRLALERLRQAIHRLLDDGADSNVPPELAQRTVAFVARESPSADDAARSRCRFACRFAGPISPWPPASSSPGTLTLLPAIQRSRERMNQAGCVFNLQQLGNSLAQYASLHPFLPYPPSHRSDTHAGMFAVMLHDAGVLDDLRCSTVRAMARVRT